MVGLIHEDDDFRISRQRGIEMVWGIRTPVDDAIDTPVEVVYYRNGGILHTVLRQLAKS